MTKMPENDSVPSSFLNPSFFLFLFSPVFFCLKFQLGRLVVHCKLRSGVCVKAMAGTDFHISLAQKLLLVKMISVIAKKNQCWK